MARIPRAGRQQLPSGAVPSAQVPQDIADVGQGLEARALGQIGRGLGDIGNVLLEIELRDRQAADLKQGSVDAAARADNKLRIEEWKNNNPLDEHTLENFQKVWDESSTFDESMYENKTAQARARIINDAERTQFTRSQAISAADTRIRDTILSTHDTYILEPNEGNRNAYEDALKLMHTGDRAETLLVSADAEITENQKNDRVNVAAAAGFGAWQATVTQDSPDGNLTAGLNVIAASDIPEGDKQEAESELKTRVTNRRLENKLQTENAAKQEINRIQGLINDGTLTGVEDEINASLNIDETEKRKLIAATRAEVDARLKDDEISSVFNQRDDAVYNDLLFRVRNDPFSITDPEIRDFTYKGFGTLENPGGITTGDYQSLANERLKSIDALNSGSNVASTPPVQAAISAFGRLRTAQTNINVAAGDDDEEFAIRRETELKFLRKQNELLAFAEANKDAKNFSELIETETARLLEPLQEEATRSWFDTLLRIHPVTSGFVRGAEELRKRRDAEDAALPHPTTPQERDALPSGTIFIDTDGKRVRKG